MRILLEAIVYLTAAIIAVPISKRLGLGSVLGYLAAGIFIGPFGASLIENTEHILHFSELGVVFLLFIIGLELQPSRLWVLRRMVFGLGSAQVLFVCKGKRGNKCKCYRKKDNKSFHVSSIGQILHIDTKQCRPSR